MSTNIPVSAKIRAFGGFFNLNSSPQIVRTSTGILYAVANVLNPNRLLVLKSINNGLTWAVQDYANSYNGSGSGVTVAVAIDGLDNLHIVNAQDPAGLLAVYIPYSTATDTFGSPYPLVGMTAGTGGVGIAVDSNNAPHIVNGATGSNKVFYTNKVSGQWKPVITVASPTSPRNVTIFIDKNNVPWIAYMPSTTASVALGNKPDATSFTTTSVSSSISINGGVSLAQDSLGHQWLAYTDPKGRVKLVQHFKTDALATWQTPIDDGYNGIHVSLAIDNTDIYILYERAGGGIAYDSYSSIQGNWLGEQILQANTPKSETNLQFHNAIAKWSNYFNYGESGNNNTGSNLIEYLFDDGNYIYYDNLVTAQMSIGYVNFNFAAVASFTTSTSSTSSSTSTSISTSSTSSSTSISTSSTSSSTSLSSTSSSISTSSTSSSISTSSTSSSISTSSTSSSTSTSKSTSTSSTSQSTSISVSTSSTSSSTSTSSTSSSISTSSTSSSISTSSTSSSISTSSTSSSISTSTSISTSSTSSSTSTTVSVTTSTSSTSNSTSSTSSSTSISTSTSTTSQSTSTSSTSTSRSTSTSSTSNSTSISTSSTSQSTSISTSTSSTSRSTSTSSTSSSTSTTSISTSTTTIAGTDVMMVPRATIRRHYIWTRVYPFKVRGR